MCIFMADSEYAPTEQITSYAVWAGYLASPYAAHAWSSADFEFVSRQGVKVLPIFVQPPNPGINDGWTLGAQALYEAHVLADVVDFVPVICLDVEPGLLNVEFANQFIAIMWAGNVMACLYSTPEQLNTYGLTADVQQPEYIWAAVPGFTGDLAHIPYLDDQLWSTEGQRAVQCRPDVPLAGTLADESACQDGYLGLHA